MIGAAGILLSDYHTHHECVELSHFLGGSAYVGSRQTSLEPQASTPASWSVWYVPSNSGIFFQRIFATGYAAVSTNQMVCSINNPGGTTTAGQKLRFLIATNAANYIYIDSAEIIKRNRAIHIVITWDGVNAAGLDMYINGVKEASPSRVTNGSYTGPLNDANLRFMVSRIDDFKTRGNIRNLAKWNKKLSDAEAAELYAGGKMRDADQISFYADIIAYWPLKTNTQCLNNVNFHLGTQSNISYTTRPFNVNSKNIHFKKATITNTRYVAFGSLIYVSATLAYWIGRSGTSHIAGGKIVKIAIHLDTETIDAPVDIITDGTYDLRGGNAAIIDGSVYVFSSRYTNPNFIDLGYYKSTDGTTGEAYGARQALTTTMAGFNCYGDICAGFSAGEYFVPMNESDSSTQYKIALYKTTDNGANWSRVEVYDGSTKLVEPSLVNLGSNTLMIIARRNGTPYGTFRIISTDGGATWDTPTLTNIGGTLGESNACQVLTDNGKVTVVYMDRSSDHLWASKSNDITTILSSATSFTTAFRITNGYTTDGYGILGYPNILNLGNNKFLVAYSTESSSSVADLFIGFGELNNL